jgi:hypothetical protein
MKHVRIFLWLAVVTLVGTALGPGHKQRRSDGRAADAVLFGAQRLLLRSELSILAP